MASTQTAARRQTVADLRLAASQGQLVPRPNKLSHLNRDRGYRWREQDPVLQRITEAISRSGWELSFISERSGVSVSTLRNWQNGNTLMPLHATVVAVFQALGYETVQMKIRSNRKRD